MTESRPLSSQPVGKGRGLIVIRWERTQWYLKSRLKQPWGEAQRPVQQQLSQTFGLGARTFSFLPLGIQCLDLKPQALLYRFRLLGEAAGSLGWGQSPALEGRAGSGWWIIHGVPTLD